MLAHLLSDWKSVFFPEREAETLTAMDGPLAPNQRLDAAQPCGETVAACDDLAVAADGSLLLSAGRQILRVDPVTGARSVYAECDAPVCALAACGDRVYAGIENAGLVRLQEGRVTARLESAAARPLRCITAIAPLPDGRLVVTEGSGEHLPRDWCRDLLRRGASGRLLLVAADLGEAQVLGEKLAWPYGVCAAADGSIWFSESWRHRVLSLPPDAAGATPRIRLRNLPGYPARLSADGAGGFWLSVFALRTHLVELVLREHRYREEMLATVDPQFWIAPSLRASGHYLEPLQGGAIKKLGLVKPWAPPRSYGLVVRLSGAGELCESLHSRVGGRHHGVTAAWVQGGRLWVVSKGDGRLLSLEVQT